MHPLISVQPIIWRIVHVIVFKYEWTLKELKSNCEAAKYFPMEIESTTILKCDIESIRNTKKRLLVIVNRPSVLVMEAQNHPLRLRFQNISQYKRSPSYFLATMHSCSSSNQCEQNQHFIYRRVRPSPDPLLVSYQCSCTHVQNQQNGPSPYSFHACKCKSQEFHKGMFIKEGTDCHEILKLSSNSYH